MRTKRIAIHSVPRSGSTWLGEIFNSNEHTNFKHQPLFSYAFKGILTDNSPKEEILDFFYAIANSDDEYINQYQQRQEGIVPTFVKKKPSEFIVYKEVRYHNIIENLLKKDNEIKVVGLVRNPMSVISSWIKAPKEFRKGEDWNELEEWRYAEKKNLNKPEEFFGYGKWKEVTLLFEKLKHEYPDRFYLLKYGELLNKTQEKVAKLFTFCGMILTKQTIDFINDSSTTDKSNDAYSVYRKKQTDDKWKSELNPEIARLILKDLKDNNLEDYI